MVYQWRPGFVHKTDPAVAAQIMTELSEQESLNAETLVEISRPEDAPLHQEFEWDDTVAAENWRKHQGRNLINALIMVPETEDEEPHEPIRAFFKVCESQHYESTQILVRSENGKEALKDQARRELASYRAKFRAVLDWTGADTGISQALDRLEVEER